MERPNAVVVGCRFCGCKRGHILLRLFHEEDFLYLEVFPVSLDQSKRGRVLPQIDDRIRLHVWRKTHDSDFDSNAIGRLCRGRNHEFY